MGSAAALAVAAGRLLTSRPRSSPCCRQRAATVAEAAEENPCPETSGAKLQSSNNSATRSSTPCAARSCSSTVSSGVCVASRIGTHTLPLAVPKVKFDVRQGEGQAMTERPRGLSGQNSSGQSSVPRTVPSLGAKRSVSVRKRSVVRLAGRSRSYETKPLSTTFLRPRVFLDT